MFPATAPVLVRLTLTTVPSAASAALIPPLLFSGTDVITGARSLVAASVAVNVATVLSSVPSETVTPKARVLPFTGVSEVLLYLIASSNIS